MVKVECFFDCSSPWAYLGFSNLLSLTTRLGVQVIWRPVVVGFVFAEVNQDVYATRRLLAPPLKSAYEAREMLAWADHAGVVVRSPPACGHPVKTVKTMRGCIALEAQGKLVPFAVAAYEALWRDGRNIGHDDVLEDLCQQAGVEPAGFFEAIEAPWVKDRLKANNADLIRRGGFGVPTFYIDDEIMLFGNNRLALVERHLRSKLRKVVRGAT